jgi:hypothetical protein
MAIRKCRPSEPVAMARPGVTDGFSRNNVAASIDFSLTKLKAHNIGNG